MYRLSLCSVFSSPSRSGSEVRLVGHRSSVSVPSSICVSSQAAKEKALYGGAQLRRYLLPRAVQLAELRGRGEGAPRHCETRGADVTQFGGRKVRSDAATRRTMRTDRCEIEARMCRINQFAVNNVSMSVRHTQHNHIPDSTGTPRRRCGKGL